MVCPEVLARRNMIGRNMMDSLKGLMDELAQLWQESKAERAGQGREHILQSIQTDMHGVQAQINAAGQQYALRFNCLIRPDLYLSLDIYISRCRLQLLSEQAAS